ncbi:unnamed protein product [Musa acuminata subsp. burmannicoides]
MEQVSWMATAPTIQGATTDIFGYSCVPDTGVLGKEPYSEGSHSVPEAKEAWIAITYLDPWTCDEMYGFLDDLNLVAEATQAAATLVAPPATESWMAAAPTSQGATADVPGE